MPQRVNCHYLFKSVKGEGMGWKWTNADKEIEINKYLQLLPVLSEANGQKWHQFSGGPKPFLIMITTCCLVTIEISQKKKRGEKQNFHRNYFVMKT